MAVARSHDLEIGGEQRGSAGDRWGALPSWRTLVRVQEIRKARDHGLMAARGHDHPATVCPGGVHVVHKPVRSFCCERFEAANARGGRQVRECSPRPDLGGYRHALHARDGVTRFRRALDRLHPAYVCDRAFQLTCGRIDLGLRSSAQVEPASCANMLRKEFAVVEGRDAGAAGRASIPKPAAMHEA